MPVYPQRGLHGHVVQVVGQQILHGTVKPGDPLDVEALEEEFGVSRTVVREALKVLAAKGLVDARPKRGTYVRPRSDWSLLDPDLLHWQFEGRADSDFLQNLTEVRSIVEPAGARLAALRRDDGDLAALRSALNQMACSVEDTEAVVAADLAFHRILLGAAHNELLRCMDVVIEAGRLTSRAALPLGDWSGSIPAHQEVLDAVRASDPDRAEAAMHAVLALSSRPAP